MLLQLLILRAVAARVVPKDTDAGLASNYGAGVSATSNGTSSAANRVVALEVRRLFNTVPERAAKQESDSEPVSGDTSWYGIDFDIGTPPQKVTARVVTGSADLWVAGPFDPALSATYRQNDTEPYLIQYGAGSSVSGTLSQDTVRIGARNITLDDVSFAYASEFTPYPPVFGIGFVGEDESQSHTPVNIPERLKDEGLISTVAYSLDLGSANSTGQLLFGGVDHSRYSGKLHLIPIVAKAQMMVTLSAIYCEDKAVSSTPVQVLLDSGTANLVLPADLVSTIVDTMNAALVLSPASSPASSSPSSSPLSSAPPPANVSVNCSSIGSNSFEFDFSGARISVPFASLVDVASLRDDGTIPDNGTCTLAIQISPESLIILGDRFLSNAYAVFDLSRREIALANRMNGTEVRAASIEAIGPGGIPRAIYAPAYNISSNGAMAGSPGSSRPENSDVVGSSGTQPSNTTATATASDFAPFPFIMISSSAASADLAPPATPKLAKSKATRGKPGSHANATAHAHLASANNTRSAAASPAGLRLRGPRAAKALGVMRILFTTVLLVALKLA